MGVISFTEEEIQMLKYIFSHILKTGSIPTNERGMAIIQRIYMKISMTKK